MSDEPSQFSKDLVRDALEGAPALLTFRMATDRTGIPMRTWHRWAAKGLIRVVRPAGGHPRIPRVEIERILRDAASEAES